MSRVLPADITKLIITYLRPELVFDFCQSHTFCNRYFWVSYISHNTLIPTDKITQLLATVTTRNPVQLCAYFNVILPASELYLCPVQCYLQLLSLDNDQRRHYLNLALPYINNCDISVLILSIVAPAMLNDKNLVDDYIDIVKSSHDYSYIEYILANKSVDNLQLLKLWEALSQVFTYKDVITDLKNRYKDGIAVIQGNYRGIDNHSDAPYRLIGRYDIPIEVPNNMALVNGYLSGNHINKATEMLKRIDFDDSIYLELIDHSLFYLIDTFDFYLAFEHKVLYEYLLPAYRRIHIHELPSEVIRFYCKSIAYAYSVNGKIFNYLLAKIDFNYINTNHNDYVNEVLRIKSILDFHGFVQIWLTLNVNTRKKIKWNLMGSNEAKALILNL